VTPEVEVRPLFEMDDLAPGEGADRTATSGDRPGAA
jgi:hypothetical protein